MAKQTNAELAAAIAAQLPALAGQYAELKTFQKGMTLLTAGLKSNVSAVVGALVETQKASVEASKVLGAGFNAEVQRSLELFKELSGEKGLGIKLEDTKQAAFEIGKTFKNTAFETRDSMDTMSAATSKYANIVKTSDMAGMLKTFAFQTGMGAKGASSFAEKMIGLSDAMHRPPEQLLKLSSELINTNIAFGSTDDAVGRLALRTDKFAHSLGISAEKVKGLLGGMMTIGDRQQASARLSQIGMMVSQQTGQDVDVDIQGLLSSDPNVQLGAFKTTLKSLSKASRNLSTDQKRSLAYTLVQSTKGGAAIGYKGVQAALSDYTKIDKITDDAKARRDVADKAAESPGAFGGFFNKQGGLDDARVKEFATIAAKAEETFAAKRLDFVTNSLKTATNSTKNLVELALIADKKSLEILSATSSFVGSTIQNLSNITHTFITALTAAGSDTAKQIAALTKLQKDIADLQRTTVANAAAIARRAVRPTPGGTSTP
jgi:hypothetical protein